MTEYKIVASDLDGTLLDSNGKISAENFAAIAELAKKGVHFVPTSGRSLAEIPDELKMCDDIRYFIHSSGAVVYDKATGERISFCFPRAISSEIFSVLFNADCHLTVRYMGRMYTSKAMMNEDAFSRYKVWGAHANLLRTIGEAIEDFEDRFKFTEDVEMISIFISDDEKLSALKNRFSEIPEVNAVSACPHNIELTYAKAGKGNALIALAEKLGFSVDQTIAVGDSENDIPMVAAAGLGLAVSNATDELKSQADEVICSNDEHAVAFIAEKFL